MTGRAREVRALTGTHIVKWEYRSLLTKKKGLNHAWVFSCSTRSILLVIPMSMINRLRKENTGKGSLLSTKEGCLSSTSRLPTCRKHQSRGQHWHCQEFCAPWLLLFIGRSSRTAFGARGANFVLRGGRWSEIAKSEAKLNSTLFGHVVAGNMTQFVYQLFIASLRSSQHFSYCYCN
jgi:hypothetical protein